MFLFIYFFCSIATAQSTLTVGTGGNYTTLKGAFDAINAGNITGTIILEVISSTTETASATLNAGNSGSANYVSVTIYPTGSGFTISGNLNGSLISLNGASNVTIDGRVNRTGSVPDLTFANLSTGNNAANCAIRFINSASNNTLQYSHLRASGAATSASAVLFSTATTGNGNDNNTIEYCLLSNSNGNRPTNLIYSSGTSARENSGNVIRYNDLFDFFRTGVTSHGIYITSYSFDWTVTGNSFYETTSFTPSGSNKIFYPIRINNASGNGFDITDNFIGGSQTECGGAAWTASAAVNHRFYAIHLVVGTGTNSVQNNTIRNFNYSSTHANPWHGIFISSGSANIGTDSGNTIGSSAGNGSVILTNTTANATSYGIYISSTGTINASNNNIGAITTIGAISLSHSFTAIIKTAVAGTTILNSNLIGSTSNSNSIHASSSSTNSTPQQVYGIYSTGTGSVTISGNTIANMHNAYARTSSTKGQVVGILTSGTGIYTIQNNIIQNLTTTSPNTSKTTAASAIGISAATTGAGKTVSENTISNLTNTSATAAVNVIGIYYAGATSGTNLVYHNFIHSLSLSSSTASAIIAGISIGSGTTTYYNNIVNIGSGVNNACIIYGMFETGALSNNNTLYFNTVFIGGQPTGNANTYAVFNNANTNIRNFRNNIFFNNRSNISGTARHYAIRLAGTTNLTINYNDYYSPGTGGTIGFFTSDRTTLSLWRTATGQDVNSVNTNPLLQNAGGTTAEDNIPLAVMQAITISGIDLDFNKKSRAATPTMGAFEKVPARWTGITSSDWGTTSNWLANQLPETYEEIIIPGSCPNYPVLDQDRFVKDVNILTDASLTIPPQRNLTVTGIISNESGIEGLIIKSDETGSGSLIHNNTGVDATIERYLPGDLRTWHSISAPVSNQSIQGSGFEPQTNDDLYLWHEPSPGIWVNYTNQDGSGGNPTFPQANNGNNNFAVGRGYIADYNELNPVKYFRGTLNAGDINIPLAVSSLKSWDWESGWNLVGNPYASSIDWDMVDKSNLSELYAQVYDPIFGGGGYRQVTTIAPQQGFFIRAAVNGAYLNLTNSVQIHGGRFYKNIEDEPLDELVIRLSKDQYFDEAKIVINQLASNEYDFYDATKLFSFNEQVPQIYSKSTEGRWLSVNSIPNINEPVVIPFTVSSNNYGFMSLNRVEMVGNFTKKNLILHDKKTDSYHNLSLIPEYNFTFVETDDPDRFTLLIDKNNLSDPSQSGNLNVFTYQNVFYLFNNYEYANLEIYDFNGRLLLKKEITEGFQYLTPDFSPGTYIVRIIAENEIFNRKVFIN